MGLPQLFGLRFSLNVVWRNFVWFFEICPDMLDFPPLMCVWGGEQKRILALLRDEP